jgi:hypothetical protein
MFYDWRSGALFDPLVAATALLGIATAVFLVTTY